MNTAVLALAGARFTWHNPPFDIILDLYCSRTPFAWARTAILKYPMMISGLHTEQVHQDQYLQIEINRKLGLIATRWLQHPPSDVFRRSMTLSADYVCSEKCRYWLSDARKVHYLELADQNWLVNTLIPRIAPYLERFARIMTEEGLTMLDIQRISHRVKEEQLKDSVETRVELFLDVESAIEWLLPENA